MKHIKKFENFSFEEEEKFGRFAQERESDTTQFGEEGNEFNDEDFDDQNCEFCNCAPCECDDAHEEDETNELGEEEDDYGMSEDQEDEDEDQEEHRIRRWGDEEIVEKKKMNPGFKAYLDKQKAKSKGKDDKKGGKGKPDFLDLDKDGDKKETMKKAAKDAKEDDKGGSKKGLKKFNEEFFGGAEGQVNINIDGDGLIKEAVINEIKKLLKNMGGDINLSVDGEKVNII